MNRSSDKQTHNLLCIKFLFTISFVLKRRFSFSFHMVSLFFSFTPPSFIITFLFLFTKWWSNGQSSFQKPREFFCPSRDLFSAQFSFPRFKCFDCNELTSFFISWFCRSLSWRLFWKLIASTPWSIFLKDESFLWFGFSWIGYVRYLNLFWTSIFLMAIEAFFLMKLFWPHVTIFYFIQKNWFF